MQLLSRNEVLSLYSPDRRTRPRFDIDLPVLLRTFGEPWKTGELKNAGAKGAFILTDTALLLGAGTEYVIRLPPALTKASRPLMIRFVGIVVRCQASGERGRSFGIGLEGRDYKYLPREDVGVFDALFEKTWATAKK